ncbi:MAG: hypothetical protein K0Q68_1469 [Moraxellaceae bacterium]|jgi:hypothetical protein|nr:hypothetical protein [Moraxellaceae bacterium]
MDRRKALLVLLLIWTVAIVAGGLWRLLALGKLTGNHGPQALSRDGQGGVFLATDHDLLHLDRQGRLLDRHPVAALGLVEINALAQGEGSSLWLYDSQLRRLFRCDTRAWACVPFGGDKLELGQNVQLAWLYGRDRRLLVSDNTHHRLLAFAEDGSRLSLPAYTWHFPNQLSTCCGSALLADSDTRRIVVLDPVGNRATATALATRERPYRFVRRDSAWWVIEAGVTLQDGRLRHYLDGRMRDIPLGVSDPVALLDIGHSIVLAAKADWRLLALDPETLSVTTFGEARLQQEFRDRKTAVESARRERERLPPLMLALLAPALLGGLFLQRRIDRAARNAAIPDATTPERSSANSALEPLAPRKALARIGTDRGALEMARAQQNRQLLRAGLILVPLLLLAGLSLWLLLPAQAMAPLAGLLGALAVLPVLVLLTLYSSRRQQDRLYDQHFICGPDKVIHVVRGKPVRALPYEAIWLGEDSLILGKQRLPLYVGHGARRSALWNIGDLQRELGTRIPHTQHLGEIELARAMLAQGRLVGLQVLSARFVIIITVILVLLLKLWQLLPHSLIGQLWKFHH